MNTKILHLLLLTIPLQAQTYYQAKTSATASTDNVTPFQIVSNQYGIVPLQANNATLQVGVTHQQNLGKHFTVQAGVDLLAATPRYQNIALQQAYADVAFQHLHLRIGAKENTQLSLRNQQLASGDLAISNNAKPIPEVNVNIPHFVNVPYSNKWLLVKGDFAIGKSFDTQYLKQYANPEQVYIKHVLWHHKALFLKVGKSEHTPVALVLGIQHLAQWGGTSTNLNSPQYKQPQTIKDFLKIVTGSAGDQNASLSDQVNVLGNHFGTYDVQAELTQHKWTAKAYYQHFFDDASGMELENIGDGIIGAEINLKTITWIQTVVVEHVYTRDQSGPFHYIEFDHSIYPGFGGGGDNYYNNQEYTTGASHLNRAMGNPLLLSPEYNNNGKLGFQHNRITAWHLGVKGVISTPLDYKIRTSTVISYGTPLAPTLTKLNNTTVAVDIGWTLQHNWYVTTTLAADKGTLTGNRLGAAVTVAKTGILWEK
jgi:hypothetical protein